MGFCAHCLSSLIETAGDLVQLLHIVHHSHFTSVVQQSEQQEEMLVRTLFVGYSWA